jgi:hypothetical protein
MKNGYILMLKSEDDNEYENDIENVSFSGLMCHHGFRDLDFDNSAAGCRSLATGQKKGARSQ